MRYPPRKETAAINCTVAVGLFDSQANLLLDEHPSRTPFDVATSEFGSLPFLLSCFGSLSLKTIKRPPRGQNLTKLQQNSQEKLGTTREKKLEKNRGYGKPNKT